MKTTRLKLKVNVSQEAIDCADQGIAESCAIAWELKRNPIVRRLGLQPSVGPDIVSLEDYCSTDLLTCDTEKHGDWIERFDEDRKAVKPRSFTFTFETTDETPEEVVQKINEINAELRAEKAKKAKAEVVQPISVEEEQPATQHVVVRRK